MPAGGDYSVDDILDFHCPLNREVCFVVQDLPGILARYTELPGKIRYRKTPGLHFASEANDDLSYFRDFDHCRHGCDRPTPYIITIRISMRKVQPENSLLNDGEGKKVHCPSLTERGGS